MSLNANRHHKNEHRKRQIIEAAVSVLKEKGVAASSMNDFIKASGLSKGGVYHHFGSKEELLIGVLNYFFERNVSDISIPDVENLTAYEQMTQLLTERQELLERVGELAQLMMDFLAHATTIPSIKQQCHFQYSHFQDHIASIIRLGIDNGEFREDTNPKAIASGIMGVFDGICTSMMVAPDRIEFPGYAVATALAILEGIRKDKP
ncbi:MAG: TetR/AcrR family transcriptional regulator [Ketobacteraceae bacterium]|nr:TetR/AcrR family transcriptional regulator [Ketobacteraceae bacterium]